MKLSDPSLLKTDAYINGQWVGSGDKRIPVTNPATGEVIAEVADHGAEMTKKAIDAAAAAQKGWAALTAKERAVIMRRWFNLIMENQEDLAQILTAEMGKPLAEARGEIAYGASFIDWFAEEGRRITGDVLMPHQSDKRLMVLKQPIGVYAAITPWNFPNAMITRKIGPGMAAGCAGVIKPAKQTPLSALAMAELADRAGVPAGVMNVINGSSASAIGNELCSNPIVRKITFTGSTEVGRLLMKQSAESIKKVSMELGGNAPLIVFDDADLSVAVPEALASKFRNAGQTCVCANRIFVQDGIYDEFAAAMKAAVEKMKLGNGAEDGVTMGPLIDEPGMLKAEEHVNDAVSGGAKVLTGGRRSNLGATFFEPTVLTDAKPSMKVFHEETFGPVAPLFRFKTEEEVIAMANDTIFGLASYFFANDMARVWRVAEQLEYGIVSVNTGIFSNEIGPFGGIKQSGIGREGSRYGIDEYLEMKYICLGM
ncbi:MAG: NAD-dependent succinate-semialdehyde dehydrogenase [Proteobacteria bacterium]|jgi:succinate-semialdehyde dehydrogenase/glutarate-semialdehyde dehydrogenase|nr:NAD-dependent succinate-semialdehyde dehydrogenase [Pseudomonadota bacterium]MDA0908264.1 NAD-dependent succinate-semialdehyde dehydrogenase [Pseudomonadota bacterium]NBR37948.1 NAD-dependent succinate-semialdehyde dehydrogenase [Alphaproteobacteria bacterium]